MASKTFTDQFCQEAKLKIAKLEKIDCDIVPRQKVRHGTPKDKKTLSLRCFITSWHEVGLSIKTSSQYIKPSYRILKPGILRQTRRQGGNFRGMEK